MRRRNAVCLGRRLPHIAALRAFAATTGVLLALALAPEAGTAQGGTWPTLRDAGLEYVSRSGFFQISISGQLDLETFHASNAWVGLAEHRASETPLPDEEIRCLRCHLGIALPGGSSSFAVPRLRVFADVFLGDQLYTLVEVRTDRGHVPTDGEIDTRLEQAFVRFSSRSGASALQVGRFATPFGSYSQRHLSVVDPFLRPPLGYDYRTVMNRTLTPVPARVLTWKNQTEFFRRPGAPPIWDVPYQWGLMMFGTLGPLDLRVAAMNSAPSSQPEAWDFTWEGVEHPSVVAGVRARATPWLELGASYDRGPWMERLAAGTIRPDPDAPPGTPAPSYRAFDQELVSVDVNVQRGPTMLRAEVIRDRWQIPNVEGDPTERIYSAEIQYDVWAGVSVAGRVGYIDFRPLDDGVGGVEDWDYDVYRWEASVGYRLARNAGVLVSGYRQTQKTADDGDTHLIGARLWWAF